MKFSSWSQLHFHKPHKAHLAIQFIPDKETTTQVFYCATLSENRNHSPNKGMKVII